MYPKYVIKFHVDFYSIGSGQNHRCTLCSPVPFLAFLFHAVVISAFVFFTSLWVQRWKWKKWCSSQGHFATWEQLPSKEHIMNSFITFWLVFPTCCRLLHMLSAHFSSSVFFFFFPFELLLSITVFIIVKNHLYSTINYRHFTSTR